MAPIGVALLLGLTGCPGPCLNTLYTFAVTASFSPQKDSLRVGDTLLLRSFFPTQPVDLRSNQTVNYANAPAIGTTLFVDELMLSPNAIGSFLRSAVADFTYVRKRWPIYTVQDLGPERVKQLRYEQSSNDYGLEVALIPLRKGVYSLAVSDGISAGRQGESCSRAAFELSVVSDKRSLSYLQAAFKRPLTRIDSLRFYVFRVY